MPLQAEEGSPIKPGQALRDERGRVNLDDLTDTDLDYGCDEKSLASLRRRLKKAINTYDGTDPKRLRKSERAHAHTDAQRGVFLSLHAGLRLSNNVHDCVTQDCWQSTSMH